MLTNDSLNANLASIRDLGSETYCITINKVRHVMKFGRKRDPSDKRSEETCQWVGVEAERRNEIVCNAFGHETPIGEIILLDSQQQEYWQQQLKRPATHTLIKPFVSGCVLKNIDSARFRKHLYQRVADEVYPTLIFLANCDMAPSDIIYTQKTDRLKVVDWNAGIYEDYGGEEPDLEDEMMYTIFKDRMKNHFPGTVVHRKAIAQKAQQFKETIETDYPKQLNQFGDGLRELLHARSESMLEHFTP